MIIPQTTLYHTFLSLVTLNVIPSFTANKTYKLPMFVRSICITGVMGTEEEEREE